MMLQFPYTFGEMLRRGPSALGLRRRSFAAVSRCSSMRTWTGNRARLGVEQIGRRTASYLGVPIPSGGQDIGVISVQSGEQEGRFTEADQRLLVYDCLRSWRRLSTTQSCLKKQAMRERPPNRPMPRRARSSRR